MAPHRLRHIHLPSSPTDGLFPTYKTAAAVQELLRRRLLDFKDTQGSSYTANPPPNPTLISFTPQPTYTLGRRQASPSSSLSPAEINRLKAPLHIPSHPRTPPTPHPGAHPAPGHTFRPAVLASPRGGLATYHGPGQVVLWPVMAIRAPAAALGHKPFSVRCYARLLEATTVALLRRRFGLRAFTTADPGVWAAAAPAPAPARKIAALGVHLRRHVSSLGVALNLDMPTTRGGGRGGEVAAGDEARNPWARFVACGLEGKGVTCVEEELRAAGWRGADGLEGEDVARTWAEELAVGMELDPGNVEFVEGGEVEEMVHMAQREGWMDVVARDEV